MRLILAAIAGSTLAAGALTSSSAIAETQASPWKVIRWNHYAPVQAAGRVWLFNQEGEGARFVTRSARVSGAHLGSWVTDSLPGLGQRVEIAALGDDLIFSNTAACRNTYGCELSAVRLHEDGSLGPFRPATGAPLRPSPGAQVVQLPDRVVQLTGVSNITSVHHAVCCSADGKPVDLSQIVPSGLMIENLGLDARDRLWLSWEPARVGKKQLVRVVQLDSTTLKPVGAPILVSARPALTHRLACADVCRVVFQTWDSTCYSRAPGEPAPTRLRPPGRQPTLLAARASAARLAVAYFADTKTDNYLRVKVAVGDARGRRLRVARSLNLPWRFAGGTITNPYGAFGPRGFVLVVPYQASRSVVARIAMFPVG